MGNELVGVRARHGAPVGRWAMMRRYPQEAEEGQRSLTLLELLETWSPYARMACREVLQSLKRLSLGRGPRGRGAPTKWKLSSRLGHPEPACVPPGDPTILHTVFLQLSLTRLSRYP